VLVLELVGGTQRSLLTANKRWGCHSFASLWNLVLSSRSHDFRFGLDNVENFASSDTWKAPGQTFFQTLFLALFLCDTFAGMRAHQVCLYVVIC
jgi:hypothetical protein